MMLHLQGHVARLAPLLTEPARETREKQEV
jgi:hypothetical protein